MPNPEKVGENALVVVSEARSIIINDKADYEKAQKIWAILTQHLKNIEEAYDDIIDAAHKSWKKALAKKAHYWKPVKDEATLLKSRMGEFVAAEKAARKAEEERLTKEHIKNEEDRILQEAEQNPEIADQILSEPVSVAPVVLPKDLPAGGPVFRTIWDFEIFDIDLLIEAVARKQVASLALVPNEKFLRQQATSFKEHFNIPGVRAYSRTV